MDHRSPSRWLLGAGLAAAIIGVAALGGCSERSAELEPTPTPAPVTQTTTPTSVPPTSTPSPTPSPTPTPNIDGVELRELLPGPLTRLEGYAIIVEVGCWACDGPANGLVRYYEEPGGAFRQDALFRAPVNPNQYINGIAYHRRDQRMAVSVCTSGYCGRVSDPTEDAGITLFESQDGGITWEVIGQYPGPVSVVGFVEGDWLLTRFPADVMAPLDFFLANSGHSVEPPPGARQGLPPRVVGDGELLWVRDDGAALLRHNGTVYFETPLEGMIVGQAVALVDLQGPVAVTWHPQERAGPTGRTYLTILERGRPRLHLQFDGELLPWHWTDDRRIIGNAWDRGDEPGVPGTHPVVVDLEDASIRPLDGPFGRGQGGSSLGDLIGRNLVRMAYEGPFARVPGPACTDVFEDPGGALIDCFAPGVILAHDGTIRSEGGHQWLRVRTPDGEIGWANAEFLAW